jgi:Mg2+-importing ATPase
MKYVRITISASFGNVLSMALASFFLPFLPMLPTQILLLNFLSDLPSVTVSWDKVDPEDLARPSTWRMRDIGHFMVIFGLVSTAFDLILFITALSILNGEENQIRSAWFATSLLTEIIAILVLRTKKAPWLSLPGKLLLWFCIGTVIVAWAVPVFGVVEFLGLPRVPWEFLVLIAGVSISYAIALEISKRVFSTGFGIPANN